MVPGSRFAWPGRRGFCTRGQFKFSNNRNNFKNTSAFPRRDAPEVLQKPFAQRKQRAQGMPGAQCTRSLACKIKIAHERSHHGHTGNHPAFPAQWFYGLLRALPGDQACLTPSSALLLADLTPASGRQNHTTSPSAAAPFVKGTTRVHRIPFPTLMTLRNAPPSGRDGANQWTDLGLL